MSFETTPTKRKPDPVLLFSKRTISFIAHTILVFCPLAVLSHCRSVSAQVSVLTQHNDNGRTGQNIHEQLLTTSNVNKTQFGKLFAMPADGYVYGQPLYVPNVDIPKMGKHNVVYFVTMNDSVYAYDADKDGDPLWMDNFGPAITQQVLTWTIPCGDPYPDMGPLVGITSTPVIDSATGTLYCVSRSYENNEYRSEFHALDIATGAEKFKGPVRIPTSVTTAQGQRTFDLGKQNQRCALALDHGYVYVCYASHCDVGPYNGYVFSFSASDLSLKSVWCDSPSDNYGMAGIWMSGQAPAIDSDGNLYLSTGNGTFSADTNGPDYGMCYVKLESGDLKVLDWFAPHDRASLDADDLDLSSLGVMLIPDTQFLVGAGKGGAIYLLKKDDMTHFHADADAIVQAFQFTSNRNDNMMQSPVYWNSSVNGPTAYFSPSGETIRAYKLTGGTFQTTPISESPAALPPGYSGGAGLSISSDGNKAGTGILWAACPTSGNPNQHAVAGTLRAYDASNINVEIWDSDQNADRDLLGNVAKFACATIAQGKVYCPTFSNQVCVYGLLDPNASLANQVAATPLTATANIHINCGGGTVGQYAADIDFVGGVPMATTHKIAMTGVNNAAPMRVYQSGRKSASLLYRIPQLIRGKAYTIRLHFCEWDATRSGQRLFNIKINGVRVISSFDIYRHAGGRFKANIQSFTATANLKGQIVVQLSATTKKYPACLQGIDCSAISGSNDTP